MIVKLESKTVSTSFFGMSKYPTILKEKKEPKVGLLDTKVEKEG